MGQYIMAPFKTFGCVISVSTQEDSNLADGRASPANPPMAAPMPVGTIITAVCNRGHLTWLEVHYNASKSL